MAAPVIDQFVSCHADDLRNAERWWVLAAHRVDCREECLGGEVLDQPPCTTVSREIPVDMWKGDVVEIEQAARDVRHG